MDIDSGQFGRDYRKKIREAVASCDVLLAVIGRQWATMRDKQGRRLNNPDDWVRLEIEAALERDIPVIPVLVDGAELPSKKQVPESLGELVYRQAIELHATSWRYDVGRLLKSLKNDEDEKAKANAPRRKRTAQERGAAKRKTASSLSAEPSAPKTAQETKSPKDDTAARRMTEEEKENFFGDLAKKGLIPQFNSNHGSYSPGEEYYGEIEKFEAPGMDFGAKVLIGPETYGTLHGQPVFAFEMVTPQMKTTQGHVLSVGDKVRVQITQPRLAFLRSPLPGAPHLLTYLGPAGKHIPIGPTARPAIS